MNKARYAWEGAKLLFCIGFGAMAVCGCIHQWNIHHPEEVTETRMQPEGLTAGITLAMKECMQETQIPEKAETVPRDTETVASVQVDKDELDLLARLIHAEVGIVREDECLYACGSVVLNRVKSDEFPDSIEEVIYQTEPTLQYACTADGNIEQEPDERCYEIAEELLRSGSCIPEDVIYQAEFEQGSGIWKEYENVVFCHR